MVIGQVEYYRLDASLYLTRFIHQHTVPGTLDNLIYAPTFGVARLLCRPRYSACHSHRHSIHDNHHRLVICSFIHGLLSDLVRLVDISLCYTQLFQFLIILKPI